MEEERGASGVLSRTGFPALNPGMPRPPAARAFPPPSPSLQVLAAIVTCGGLCPGLNDVVQNIVYTLHDHGVPEENVLGIRSLHGREVWEVWGEVRTKKRLAGDQAYHISHLAWGGRR